MSRKSSVWVAVVTAALVAGTGSSYAAGTLPTGHARRPVAANSTTPHLRHEIAALFNRWNAALASGNAYRVAGLYAPDAVLLPTVSPRIRTTHREIVDYFTHFLESRPVGRIQRRYIHILSRDAAIDTGLYQFTLTNRNGSRSVVNARYTFVYERRGGRWLIVNHHSSAVPSGG